MRNKFLKNNYFCKNKLMIIKKATEKGLILISKEL
jgi:hypothetical protein